MAQESHYTPEKGAAICELLAQGVSLLAATKRLGIPYTTARNWEDDVPQHGADSMRARAKGCHALAEEALEIADTPEMGEEVTIKADGSEEVKRGDMIHHRRLRIDTRMRLIGKWLPNVYGDKQQIEHSGSVSIAETLRAAREKRRGDG